MRVLCSTERLVVVVIPFAGGIEGVGEGNRLLLKLLQCITYPLYGQRKPHLISGSHVLIQLLRGKLVFLY